MSEKGRAPLRFGSVIIVGGGCYGSYYVQQLQRAAAAGAVRMERLVVVDRDPACQVAQRATAQHRPTPQLAVEEWATFFATYLAGAGDRPSAAAEDAIVPSPLMPHLLYEWVADRLRARWPGRDVRTLPLTTELPVPWQRTGADGTHYASFATWMCPINCIEPARCPHTRGPRDWSMPVALQRHVHDVDPSGRPAAGPYVFHCTHRAYGVGMIDVSAVLEADAALARHAALGPVDALVGTVSHCHGAVCRLVVEGWSQCESEPAGSP